MTVKFEWDNPNKLVEQVIEMLRAKGRAIARVPEAAVRRGTFELLAMVQKLTPKKTSTLVRSLTATVERLDGTTVEGRVGTWLKYAPFVEYGTGIHGPEKRPILIMARAKRGLFWGAYDADGKPIIRRSVKVLGMKPRAMFGQGVASFVPRYIQIIEQELAKETA